MSGPLAVPFQTGQIVVVGAGPERARRWYRTTVQRIDSRIVWVDGAPEDQPLVQVQPGEIVTCHTWRYMDALYQAEARVAFARLEPNPLIGLTVVKAERVQQREYVRVPLSTVAMGAYLDPDERFDDLDGQPLQIDVHDLSAGGLRGTCDLPLMPGDELSIDLALPPADIAHTNPAATDARRSGRQLPTPIHLRGRVVALPDLPEPLNLRARVVRLIETGRPIDLTREIGVVFVDLSRAAQERIIRFALNVQRERRRRGDDVIQFDKNGFPISEPKTSEAPAATTDAKASDAAVQDVLASLVAREEQQKLQPNPGEIKWKLTTIIYPAVLLVFVALYVTSLSAGSQPEVALFQAGAASMALAILGRAAVGILGDDSRLVLTDTQIVAMARTGAVRDIIQSAGAERGSNGAGQPPTAAQTAGAGGKE